MNPATVLHLSPLSVSECLHVDAHRVLSSAIRGCINLCKLSTALLIHFHALRNHGASLTNTIDLVCIVVQIQETCRTREVLNNLNKHDVDTSKTSKASFSE